MYRLPAFFISHDLASTIIRSLESILYGGSPSSQGSESAMDRHVGEAHWILSDDTIKIKVSDFQNQETRTFFIARDVFEKKHSNI